MAPTRVTAPTVGRQVIAAIGIDRYANWRPLSNAVGDAVGATALFRRLGFDEVAPPLLDERATRDAIDALVTDELTSLDANDSLIVFYAGHGGTRTQRVGGHDVRTGYLIPVDAAGESGRVKSWIELDPWLRRISKLPPRHILVILDACFSGIALSRVVKWGRGSGALIDLPFAAANARHSRLVITSAADDEQAMDSGPVAGHSLFTGCLIEALTGGVSPVGQRGDRHVTIGSRLGNYVRDRVQTYPGRPGWRQTPDLGTFDYDDRGEMLIPVLIEADHAVAAPASAARRSGEREAFASLTSELYSIEAAAIDSMALEAAAIEAVAIAAMTGAPPPEPKVAEPEAAVTTKPQVDARETASPSATERASSAALPRSAAWSRRVRWSWIAVSVMGVFAGVVVAIAMDATPDAGGDGPRAAKPSEGTAASGPPATIPAGSATHGAATTSEQRPAPSTGSAVPDSRPGGQPDRPATGSSGGSATSVDRGVPGREAATSTGSAKPGRDDAGASRQPLAPARPPVAPSVSAAAAAGRICPTWIDAPKGASVWWNGVAATVPVELRLPCNVEVELTFSKPHYATATRKVMPVVGGRPVNARLQKQLAEVVVRSTPPGATVTVGRKSWGITPTKIKVLEFEASMVTFAKDGYASVTEKLNPSEDGAALQVTLVPVAPKSP